MKIAIVARNRYEFLEHIRTLDTGPINTASLTTEQGYFYVPAEAVWRVRGLKLDGYQLAEGTSISAVDEQLLRSRIT